MFQKSIAAVIVIFILIAGYNFIGNSPEKLIKLTLSKIEEKASFDRNYHPFERLKRAKELANNFTDSVEVEFKVPGEKIEDIYGQDQLVKYVTVSGNYLEAMDLRFKDVSIELADDSAIVTVTALVDAVLKGGERDRYAQELEFNFVNLNDVWLIKGGKNIDLLER